MLLHHAVLSYSAGELNDKSLIVGIVLLIKVENLVFRSIISAKNSVMSPIVDK